MERAYEEMETQHRKFEHFHDRYNNHLQSLAVSGRKMAAYRHGDCISALQLVGTGKTEFPLEVLPLSIYGGIILHGLGDYWSGTRKMLELCCALFYPNTPFYLKLTSSLHAGIGCNAEI